MDEHRRACRAAAAAAVVMAGLLVSGCIRWTTVPAPAVGMMHVHVHVREVARPGVGIVGATVRLHTSGTPDSWASGVTAGADGYVMLTVPASLTETQLQVRADGWQGIDRHEVVSADRTIVVTLAPVTPPLARLHVDGRVFRRADGTRWTWRGLTAFRLLKQLADGDEAAAIALLDFAAAHGVTIVRTLTTAVHLFDLAPEAGRAALPRLLELAEARGLYVEAVGLADTAPRAFDHQAHLQALGAIAAAYPNALLEIANEPYHSTQLDVVGDPAYLLALRRLVPSTVLCALGAAKSDESSELAGGDYVTVHSSRKDGDRHWRSVRHLKDLRDLSHDLEKPVVDDEPIGAAEETDLGKRDADPVRWLARGLLTRILPLGQTFHYDGGLQAQLPTGQQLVCFEAWRQGQDALPEGLEDRSTFQNLGWPTSPVKGARVPTDDTGDAWTVLRAFTALDGTTAYSALLALSGDPEVELRDGWRVEQRQTWDGLALWRLAR